MPTITANRLPVTECLTLLKKVSGADGRLSEADVKAAKVASPADAALIDAFVDFLRTSNKANGRTMVVLSNPLGNGQTSASSIADEFLAGHTGAAQIDAPPVAPEVVALPSKAEVTHALNLLTAASGSDKALGESELEQVYRDNPEQVALLAQLTTFLKVTAKANGHRLSMNDPLSDGSRSSVKARDAFLAQYAEQTKPPVMTRVPKNGDQRPIPGTSEVAAPMQTYQDGLWLDFKFDPDLRATGSRCQWYNTYRGTWDYKAPDAADKAQLSWERRNPELAELLHSKSAGKQAQASREAELSMERAAEALEEARALAAIAQDPWANQTDNFAVRLRMDHQRVYNLITSGGGGGGYTRGGTDGVRGVDLPSMRVVDPSGHTVHVVDMPTMVDASRGNMDAYFDSVDARWNAATHGNFNGGTFKPYGR